MPAISQLPKGLLQLLGLQSFGETPKDLANVVSPVLELGDMYLSNRMAAALGDDAAPAIGSRFFTAATAGFPSLVGGVPANELWYLHAFHVSCAPGAATDITIQPRIRASNTSICWRDPLKITGVAGNPVQMVPAGVPAGGIWLPPGSEFAYLCSGITGAPGTVSGVAWVSRFGALS